MGAVRHLVSLVSSLWVIANLGFWMFFIFLLAALKLLLGWIPACRQAINWLLEGVYRSAVFLNSFWMLNVVGVEFDIDGELPLHPAPIIVVNHQTWFDIPVVHHVITDHGPILKFLIKRQLVWVPIVGWICWALNFPRLNRGTGEGAREKDYAAIESASTTLTTERGALLIYAEGTRFTKKKHELQESPYRHLLRPRPGGLKIALASVPSDTPVVDVSIAYTGAVDFWRALGGETPRVTVRIRNFRASEIEDPRTWLESRWEEKDAWLDQMTPTMSS